MSIKATRIVFWVATILISLSLIPGIFFMTQTWNKGMMQHLGMPYWFHIELGIGKFLGGLILILPFIPARIKEWAYVALGIDSLSAVIALLSVDGPKPMSFEPLIIFAILLISYISYHRLNVKKEIIKA
jgi:hypothetical protein